ncbi:hypothetical protein [Halobacterium bonnevillei]|uniref:Uncharacterized protein n=1 Tax=Halobacterium bonnevillei TaxID=2692200 RepID=A0A6B0SLD7_9EURY|nr:hypothetical protein [Halobacterium bonnevillei]MXR22445.1 hypothetical protein [Halobacterium bonnevillei]
MAKTVDDLRNEIRVAVGRFEREASAAFTKEELAAVSEAVDAGVGAAGRPGKAEMRAGIRERVDGLADPDEETETQPFRKADLEAIAAAVGQA